jgi:hypothetical protein
MVPHNRYQLAAIAELNSDRQPVENLRRRCWPDRSDVIEVYVSLQSILGINNLKVGKKFDLPTIDRDR